MHRRSHAWALAKEPLFQSLKGLLLTWLCSTVRVVLGVCACRRCHNRACQCDPDDHRGRRQLLQQSAHGHWRAVQQRLHHEHTGLHKRNKLHTDVVSTAGGTGREEHRLTDNAASHSGETVLLFSLSCYSVRRAMFLAMLLPARKCV